MRVVTAGPDDLAMLALEHFVSCTHPFVSVFPLTAGVVGLQRKNKRCAGNV